MASRYDRLVSIFRRLGVEDADAEGWVRSEVDEGIPHLLRFLFLRGMWKGVIDDNDTKWMDAFFTLAKRDPNGPLSGVGAALQRLLAGGADPRDLCELVRGMQYDTLFHIAYLLNDPAAAWGDVRGDVPEVEDVDWGLWREDSEGRPIERVDCLHEDALGMDPTGREMRPAPKTTS
jgi:hypothetical protein